MQTPTALQAEARQPWTWPSTNRIGRKKVSRALTADVVFDLEKAWEHARTIGQPCNVFLSIRPVDIDDHGPAERQRIWQRFLNKVAQYARDNAFEPTFVWSRESDVGTGKKEHLHVLVHIPNELREHFKTIAEGWLDEPGAVDARNASYGHRWVSGKKRSVIRYITKNSSQAAYACPDRLHRRGGPILGKRAGCTRNLSPQARAAFRSRLQVRQEFGQDRAVREDLR